MGPLESVDVAVSGDVVIVRAPYHPAAVTGINALGGYFDGYESAWRLPRRFEQDVRKLLIKIYGTDGPGYDQVSVRIDAYRIWQDDEVGGDQAIYFAGRRILFRPSSDLPATLGRGVSIASGFIPKTGGSPGAPSLGLGAGVQNAVFLNVYGVPAGHSDVTKSGVWIIGTGVPDRRALEDGLTTLRSRVESITDSLNRHIEAILAQLDILNDSGRSSV